jgi:exodeoxyribonuclease VII small subunit
MSKKKINFEESLAELESIVDSLEAGELSLEESLKSFEKGITLTRNCQTALTEAEQKVKVLTEKNGVISIEDLQKDQDDTIDV